MATKPTHARPYHAAGVMDMELNRFTSARATFFKGLLIAGGGGFNFDRVKGDLSMKKVTLALIHSVYF